MLHLVEWLPGLLGVTAPATPKDDLAAAWRIHTAWVQSILDDLTESARQLTNPHIGEMAVGDAIGRFYTPDVFMHAWDLAKAAGLDHTLDADVCADMLGGMTAYEEAMRGSGQFGPAVPVPADAPVQDRLLGFIGRDPYWVSPAS